MLIQEKPFLDTKIISKTHFFKYPQHWLSHSLWTNISPNSNYIQFAFELDQLNIQWKRSEKNMNNWQIVPAYNYQKWSQPEIQTMHQLARKYGYEISQELVTKNWTSITVPENRGFRLIKPRLRKQ